jgi:hypothetical protein
LIRQGDIAAIQRVSPGFLILAELHVVSSMSGSLGNVEGAGF